MSGIYLSTGVFRGETLGEMADACEEMGVGLELSSGVRWHAGLEAEIYQVKKRKGLPLLVHNYFPPPEKPFVLNLASVDPEALKRSVEHVRQAIDLSARCGAEFYAVHSGFAINLRVEDLGKPEAQMRKTRVPYEHACFIFRNALTRLSAYGKERGVRLLIENNVITREQVEAGNAATMTDPGAATLWLLGMITAGKIPEEHVSQIKALSEMGPDKVNRFLEVMIEQHSIPKQDLAMGSPLLMTEPGEIARFLRELEDPNVGLLLDVGHAKVAAGALGIEPERYFEELAPWIGAVHLSDNDGGRDNNMEFAADAWFAKYFLGHVPVVIEVYGIGAERAREQVEIVRGWVGR